MACEGERFSVRVLAFSWRALITPLDRFLRTELSWSVSKVDDELTPIVQRIARRGQVSATFRVKFRLYSAHLRLASQAGAMNKQTILDPFFDASLGKGMFAPRLRTKYPSKRLQAVIKMFREAEARIRGEIVPEHFGEMLADLEDEPLREVDPNDANQLENTGQDAAGIKRKVSGGKRKRTSAGEGEENAGAQKKAPRRRKTQDSEVTADKDDSEATGGRSRASSNASARGKRGKPTRGGARGSRTERTRTTRSETTAQPMEGEDEPNVTGTQPVSSPLGDQGYDQLFLEIASDPVEPEEDHPTRPRPRQRKNVDGPI
jgi:DNA excision repair protein ERCC-5